MAVADWSDFPQQEDAEQSAKFAGNALGSVRPGHVTKLPIFFGSVLIWVIMYLAHHDLKRSLGGTYVSVATFHLFRYLDEQAWRYNHRHASDGERFKRLLNSVVGKRLTYRTLTAQNDAGFMGLQ